MADRGNEARVGDEELRRRQDEFLDEMMRLLRADAQIMETVKDMIQAAGEEAARRPTVYFQPPRGEEAGRARSWVASSSRRGPCSVSCSTW